MCFLSSFHRVLESHKKDFAELKEDAKKNAAAIMDNANEGFHQIQGELAKERSLGKIARRENQNAHTATQNAIDSLTKSAKKTERMLLSLLRA